MLCCVVLNVRVVVVVVVLGFGGLRLSIREYVGVDVVLDVVLDVGYVK